MYVGLVECRDGYLHPEVGIDADLEKLLAEDPGLYLDGEVNSVIGNRQDGRHHGGGDGQHGHVGSRADEAFLHHQIPHPIQTNPNIVENVVPARVAIKRLVDGLRRGG